MPDLDQQIRDEIIRHGVGASMLRNTLRDVLDLHRPHYVYDGECDHNHRKGEPGVVDVEDVGLVCADTFDKTICRACCMDGSDYQTEECADRHPLSCYPCSTVRAAARAFGIGGDDQ